VPAQLLGIPELGAKPRFVHRPGGAIVIDTAKRPGQFSLGYLGRKPPGSRPRVDEGAKRPAVRVLADQLEQRSRDATLGSCLLCRTCIWNGVAAKINTRNSFERS
jgi:hypothetical protein